MTVAAKTRALTAKLGFIAQRDVDDAALAAVHRVEAEGFGSALDLLSGNARAHPKLGDAQHAEIIGVERQPGMVVIRNAQRLHGEVLERQEKLGLVRQQKLHIGPFELHHHLGIFDLGVGRIAFFDLILDVEVGVVQNHIEELFYAWANGIDCVFGFAQSSLPDAGILCLRGYE